MSDYGYKVMMTSEVCLGKQAVAFHDDRFLGYYKIAKRAERELSSQTCLICNKNHKASSYVATDVERGEPDQYGVLHWRDVYPPRLFEQDKQMEFTL